MQLLSNETTKYEVSFREGNTTHRHEFLKYKDAILFATSFRVQSAKWVVLTTMEKLK